MRYTYIKVELLLKIFVHQQNFDLRSLIIIIIYIAKNIILLEFAEILYNIYFHKFFIYDIKN